MSQIKSVPSPQPTQQPPPQTGGVSTTPGVATTASQSNTLVDDAVTSAGSGGGSSAASSVTAQLHNLNAQLEGLAQQQKALAQQEQQAEADASQALQKLQTANGAGGSKPSKAQKADIADATAAYNAATLLVSNIQDQVSANQSSIQKLKQQETTLKTVALPNANATDRQRDLQAAQSAENKAQEQSNANQTALSSTNVQALQDWQKNYQSGGGSPPDLKNLSR